MKKLLIGGAGFIGINTADYFLGKGDTVTILDNFSRKGTDKNVQWLNDKYPKNLKIIKADISVDYTKILDEVKVHDVVYHFAAQVAVTTSVTNPREDFMTNALGTFNVLEAIRNSSNKPKLLFTSTNKVYGGMEYVDVVDTGAKYEYKNLKEGVSEETQLDFHSPYGCSKGSADQYVRDYSRIYGLDTVVFRQSCIYGTRQFGVEDQGWVAWFTIAHQLNYPITVYGDGKQVRDILFIDDLVRAFDLAIENIHKTRGQVYNIGGGPDNQMSLIELMDFLEEYSGRKVEFSTSDWRPGDQKVFICNIDKAKEEFGWEPLVKVKDGTKKLYEWVKENPLLFG